MALNIWIWITAGVTASFSIFVAFLLFYFIVPMKNSFARHVVKAKRDGKPIFFMDAGKFFRCVIGDDKVGKESSEVYKSGQNIIKGGQGMKYCQGVLMGVGEDFRSLTANIAVLDLMEMINAKGWDAEEVDARLQAVTEKLKEEFGITDDVAEIEKIYQNELTRINEKYDNERNQIIQDHKVEEAADDKDNN